MPDQAHITDVERTELALKIRKTIGEISKSNFKFDPLVVADASRSTSAISSAYKRHGLVLETAFKTALNTRSDMKAWDVVIKLPSNRHKTQVDLITLNNETSALMLYEIKRAFGKQHSGAVRSIIANMLALKAHLPTYAINSGYKCVSCDVAIIGYYGELGDSLGPVRVVRDKTLAKEFDAATASFIADVNDYFRHCLTRQTVSYFARALEQVAELERFRGRVDAPGRSVADLFTGATDAPHPWDDLA